MTTVRSDNQLDDQVDNPGDTDVLAIDVEAEVARISASLRGYLTRARRKGATVALSGGIDSSVVAALCVAAIGKDRVFGIHMPERDSSEDTLAFSTLVSDSLGIDSVVEDITPVLEAARCYERRDDAIRMVCPDYGPDHKSKIVLPSVVESESLRLYSVVVQAPDGTTTRHRLTTESYLGIVAATNYKQRARRMTEYYHADRLNYVVTGTPNRLEYDQGFFVKLGDGAADVKPIAHLYKTQVYALADFLGVPEQVRTRPSTTDTYSLPQSQEEFYFSLPWNLMDLCLHGKNTGRPIEQVAESTGLTTAQVERVYGDIDQKRKTTAYLHLPPQLVEPVEEIG